MALPEKRSLRRPGTVIVLSEHALSVVIPECLLSTTFTMSSSAPLRANPMQTKLVFFVNGKKVLHCLQYSIIVNL